MVHALPGLLLLLQVQTLVPIDAPGAFAERIRQLCPVADSRDNQALIKWENRLADSASLKPTVAAAWSELGCPRALLAANGAIAREGTLMPLGSSWFRGALNVLLKALDLRPGDARAAGVLAAFALSPRVLAINPQSSLVDDLAMTIYQAVRAGVASPTVFRACTRLLIEAGDVATARDCSSRAMQSGFDSTWHLLRLARASLAEGDTIAGVDAFERAADAANDSSAMSEFLFPFFVRADWMRWAATSGPERQDWVQDSLFPAQMLESDSVSFAILLAKQLERIAGGGGQSAYWFCMAHFTEGCSQLLVRGETTVWTAARFHQLWDAGTGAEIALITYGLRVGHLVAQNAGESRIADATIDVRTWDEAAGVWSDTSFLRHLRYPASAPKNAFATGLAVIPVSPGVTSWTIQVRQSESRRGRAFDDRRTALDPGPLLLSDLVVGGEQQGLPWTHAGQRMFVAPLGHVKRAEPVQLWYQIASDRDRPRLTAAIIVRPVEADTGEEVPALEISYDVSSPPGIKEVTLMLDLSRLQPGRYRLELELTDDAEGISVRRETILLVD